MKVINFLDAKLLSRFALVRSSYSESMFLFRSHHREASDLPSSFQPSSHTYQQQWNHEPAESPEARTHETKARVQQCSNWFDDYASPDVLLLGLGEFGFDQAILARVRPASHANETGKREADALTHRGRDAL